MRRTDYQQVRNLASAILLENKNMIALVEGLQESLRQLKGTFLDDGIQEVETFTNDLMNGLTQTQESYSVLAQELLEFADILEAVKKAQVDTSGSGSYSSPYHKTQFSGTVTYKDPKSKQRVAWESNRTIYENSRIDPQMVVPAGTKYANGRSVTADTTNLKLMDQGKAPFIPVNGPDGGLTLVPVELHHISGEETQHGSSYFTGEGKDGTLVEIAATVHDAYSRQLHIGNSSFRHDADGGKTEDAAKYEKFRSYYWKYRAQKFRNTQ